MFEWLFDKSMGAPGPAGHWGPWLTLLFCTSNFLTAMALMSVPIVVAGIPRVKRHGIRPEEWWVLLSLFPALAAGRAIRFAEFGGVPYHLTTLIDAAGAVISLLAASQLPRIAERMTKLPSREEIHQIRQAWNTERIDIVAERLAMRENYRMLSRQIDALEVTLLDAGWSDHVRQSIPEMRAILEQIGEIDHGN